MRTFLQNIAIENDWYFEYSRQDYHNLVELETGKVGLFVDPLSTDSKFTEYGQETITTSGKFMLLLNSDVDESYEDKYLEYIQPLVTQQLQIIKFNLACSSFEINSWKVLEVINLFDQNLDGVLITFACTLID